VAEGNVTVDDRSPEEIAAFPVTSIPAARQVPFRPTDMTLAAYQAIKAAAGVVRTSKPVDGSAPVPMGVTFQGVFAGGAQSDNGSVGQPAWQPPDTSGAIGSTQFVETLNSYVSVYNRTGSLLSRFSLNSLAGYSTEALFDPRVLWDPVWNRWVITAAAFPESSTVQRLFIMVSKTASAAGAWWIYSTNIVSFTQTGAFWDYPSLGMDQDGLIMTANVFGTSSFLGAYTFALSKAQAYNGHPQGFAVFGGLSATLQPPIVVKTDLNGYAWLAAAPNGSGTIKLYAMRDSSRPNVTALFGPYTATGVPAFGVPPAAPQGAPCNNTLDSGDNRFVQAHTQSGDRLWQVHTVALGSFPAPRYYVIKGLSTFAPTVAQTNLFYKSATSYDFNASIAADAGGNMLMTWSATDPTVGSFAQVRHVGRLDAGAAISGTGGGQGVTFQSGACLAGSGTQRWGDYSQVSLDPNVAAKMFWWVNESIAASNNWWSHIGHGVVF